MDTDEIIRLYTHEMLSYRQIGTRLGMHYAHVRRIVVAAGVSRSRAACKQGPLNPSWNGGRWTDARGYVHIKRPEHPNADGDGYVLEHRLVMEAKAGRYLTGEEHVHHRDENPSNNDPNNLELLLASEHIRRHKRGNWRKSHCSRGHLLSDETVYYPPGGGRKCRLCVAIRRNAYKSPARG